MDKIIRKTAEKNEHLLLSQNASFADKSLGRSRKEDECPIRTCFQRDRDRIIHSDSFRRLKHKTQVFLSPGGDHYRTRLTHTLEVAQIARTIARALALNEDLTEAAALGHDLGHTPFGHAGERALKELSGIDFKHYEQSVRVVEKIEKHGKGLNLTAEVKNAIACHAQGEKAFTLEGQIIRYADKIAYINHDIDDATAAGLISEEDIPIELRNALGFRKSERINRLVTDVISHSDLQIAMSDDVEKSFKLLCDFMYNYVYNGEICKKEDDKGCCIIEKLYLYYSKNVLEMPEIFVATANAEGTSRAVCDYIAGMSDTYALKKYSELFIPKFMLD